jgi:hypothetical protein
MLSGRAPKFSATRARISVEAKTDHPQYHSNCQQEQGNNIALQMVSLATIQSKSLQRLLSVEPKKARRAYLGVCWQETRHGHQAWTQAQRAIPGLHEHLNTLTHTDANTQS